MIFVAHEHQAAPLDDQGFASARGRVVAARGRPQRQSRATARRWLLLLNRAAALVLFVAVAFGVATFPVERLGLAIGLGAICLAAFRRPAAWAGILPAVLPAIDLTSRSGRFFFDEFDLCVVACLAAMLWHAPAQRRTAPGDRWAAVLVGCFASSCIVATLLTLSRAAPSDFLWTATYRSPYNALRLTKAGFYAMALFTVARRRGQDFVQLRSHFATGMVVGLSALIAEVLVERVRFSGLFDRSSDFRVVGSFSTMHTGGAPIDAYLLAAIPLLAVVWRGLRGLGPSSAILLVLIGSAYAVLATWSRATIFLATIELSFVLLSRLSLVPSLRRWRLHYLGLLAAPALISFIVMASPFVKGRFQGAAGDWQRRVAHWREVLTMRGPDPVSRFLGCGVGTFPKRLAAARPEAAAADYRIVTQDGNSFLRVIGGDPIYFGQFVAASADQDYLLSYDCRQRSKNSALGVLLCEKTLQYSARCVSPETASVPPSDEWAHVSSRLSSGEVGGDSGSRFGRWTRRPVNLAFLVGGGSDWDLDNVRLVGADGRDLIANGGFDDLHDHWFYAADNHVPWHEFNLYVHLLFEQGWLGLLTFAAMSAYGLARATAAAGRGDFGAMALAVSLSALLLLGFIDTVIDAPRIAFLYYLLLGFALLGSTPLHWPSRE